RLPGLRSQMRPARLPRPRRRSRPESTLRSRFSFLRLRCTGALALAVRTLAVRTPPATVAALAGEAREELVDEALEHDRRLSLIDAAAFLQEGVEAARADAHVLAAEQPLGLDAREAVLGDLVVLRVDAHAHHRLVYLGIEADAVHLADAHAGHGDGRS